jgi:ankyrin repeat protein
LLSGWGDPKAVNTKDQDGNTALALAAAKQRLDICDMLIKKGADVNSKVKLR